MRIISRNMCIECCYCIEDYDDNGLCCKDNIYKHVKLNQSACRYFCCDDGGVPNQYKNIIQHDTEDAFISEDDYEDYGYFD